MADDGIDIPVNLVIPDNEIKRLLKGRTADIKVNPLVSDSDLRKLLNGRTADLKVTPVVTVAALKAAFKDKTVDIRVQPVVSASALKAAFKDKAVDVKVNATGGTAPTRSPSTTPNARATNNPPTARAAAAQQARQARVAQSDKNTVTRGADILARSTALVNNSNAQTSLRELGQIRTQAERAAQSLDLRVQLTGAGPVRQELERLSRQAQELQAKAQANLSARQAQVSQGAAQPAGFRAFSTRFQSDPDVESQRRSRRGDTARLQSAAAEVAFGSRESQGARLFRSAGRVGAEIGPAAVATGLLVRAAIAAFSSFRLLTAEIRETANAAGLTAVEASKVLAITKQVGIDPDRTSRALVQFAKNADDPRLKNFGLVFKGIESGSLNTIDALGQVADQFVALTGQQTAQSNLLFATFGRQADTLVPLLEKGSKGIRELTAAAQARGEIFTSADLKRAKDLELQIKALQQQLKGTAATAIGALAPALIGTAGFFQTAISKSQDALKSGVIGIKKVVNSQDVTRQQDLNAQAVDPNNFGVLNASQLAEFEKNSAASLEKFSTDFLKRINEGKVVAQDATRTAQLGKFSIGGGQGAERNVGFSQKIEIIGAQGGVASLKLFRDQLKLAESNGADLGSAVSQLYKAIAKFSDSAIKAGTATDQWRTALDLTPTTIDDLRNALDGTDAANKAFNQGLQTQLESLAEIPSARRGVESSALSLAAAERELNAAIRDSSSGSLVSRRRANQEQIDNLEIIKSREDFGKSITAANRSIADAERDIGRNQSAAAGNRRNIARAERDYQRALEDTPRALRDVAAAELALIRERRSAAELPLRIAAAERTARDARTSQVDGLVTLKRAQEDFNKTARNSAAELSILNAFGGVQQDQADKVAAAERDVTEAQRERNKVLREQVQNTAELIKASEGLTGVTRSYGEFIASQKAALAVNTEQPQSERLAATEEKIRAAQKELARTQAGLNNIDPTQFQRAPQDAARAVRDARTSVADSPAAVAAAEADLTDIRANGALEASLGLASAEDRLTDARRTNADQADNLLDKSDAVANAQDTEARRVSALADLYSSLTDAKNARDELRPGGLAALKLEGQELDLQLKQQDEAARKIQAQADLVSLRLTREEAVTAEVDARLKLVDLESKAIGVFDTSLKLAQDRLIALGVNIKALQLADPTIVLSLLGKTPFTTEDPSAKAAADRRASSTQDATFLGRSVVAIKTDDADQAKLKAQRDLIGDLEARRSKLTKIELEALAELQKRYEEFLASVNAKSAKPILDLTNEGTQVVKRQQGLVSETQARIDQISAELKIKGLNEEKAAALKAELEQLLKAIQTQKEILAAEEARLAELRKRAPVGPVAREKGGSFFPGQRILSNEVAPETWSVGGKSWVNPGGPRIDVVQSMGYITPHNVKLATSSTQTIETIRTQTVFPAIETVAIRPTLVASAPSGPSINIDMTVNTKAETSSARAMEMAAAFSRALLLST